MEFFFLPRYSCDDRNDAGGGAARQGLMYKEINEGEVTDFITQFIVVTVTASHDSESRCVTAVAHPFETEPTPL